MPSPTDNELDALRAAKSRLEAITNHLPAMIGYWDRDLRCEFANHAYLEWFGLSPQKVIGLHMIELMGEDLFRLNEPYARMALSGHEQRFERELLKADGTIGYTDARYIPDRDGPGSIRGFFVLVSDITELHQAYARVRELAQRLESAREDERKRVSRMLHERIAQDLFSIKLWITQLASESKIDLANSELDRAIVTAVDKSIEVVRNLANDLHPDALAHLPLSAALTAYARQFSSLSGLQILVTENASAPIILDEETRLAFYRAAQELLTNVTRHAQASKVEISLRADATCLVMEVSDDGIGIDPAAVDKDGAFGLLGVQERFVAIGGTLKVRQNESAGITVSISTPVTRGDPP